MDQLPTNALFLLLTNSLMHSFEMAVLSEERKLALLWGQSKVPTKVIIETVAIQCFNCPKFSQALKLSQRSNNPDLFNETE